MRYDAACIDNGNEPVAAAKKVIFVASVRLFSVFFAHGCTPQHASDLAEWGFVVVPILHEPERRRYNEEFFDLRFVEFADRPTKGCEQFAALPIERTLATGYGHPSSFHHPWVRRLRDRIDRSTSLLFAAHEAAHGRTHRGLETLFERFVVQDARFRKLVVENWDNDIFERRQQNASATATGDSFFAGWLNLDHDHSQTFEALAGSHKQQTCPADPDMRLKLQAKLSHGSGFFDAKGRVVVPPGHLLLFAADIWRCSSAVTPPHKASVRFLQAFRVTENIGSSLFDDVENTMRMFDVPRLPNGTKAPMYARTHFVHWQKLHAWATETFDPAFLAERTVCQRARASNDQVYNVPGGNPKNRPLDQDFAARCETAKSDRCMLSLADYGMPATYAPYTTHDARLMRACVLPRLAEAASAPSTPSPTKGE